MSSCPWNRSAFIIFMLAGWTQTRLSRKVKHNNVRRRKPGSRAFHAWKQSELVGAALSCACTGTTYINANTYQMYSEMSHRRSKTRAPASQPSKLCLIANAGIIKTYWMQPDACAEGDLSIGNIRMTGQGNSWLHHSLIGPEGSIWTSRMLERDTSRRRLLKHLERMGNALPRSDETIPCMII